MPHRIFVVHHHRASHDHDDFRLQLGGVLRSWAVPKRLSRRVGVHRLAVEVEDHPLRYASFEGSIPKGSYGAGTVEIWDHGTWEPEGPPARGLRAGHLAFTLHGKKLTGRWSLVRLPKGSAPVGTAHWLLTRTGPGHRSLTAGASGR